MLRQKYFHQLDSLRAIAIALVILFHWFPEGRGVNIVQNGPLGVTLFFVISGFLITRILLLNRGVDTDAEITKVYKSFMARRILRIFPIYYLLLFSVWVAQFILFIPKIETDFYLYPAYYLFYFSNFLIEQTHNWSDTLSILWSLAVEEQFYIFWPLIILFTPKKNLKKVIVATILLGIGSRVLFSFAGYREGVLMPSCLDAFGLGAFWAYILVYNDAPERLLRRLKILAAGSLALFLFFCVYRDSGLLHVMLFRTSMSVFCLYFVARASYGSGFQNLAGSLLDNGSLRYIGKISYGLYIYHLLVPSVLIPLMVKLVNRFLHIEIVFNEWTMKFTSLLLLVMVASMSWYLFETPITRLKRFFILTTEQK